MSFLVAQDVRFDAAPFDGAGCFDARLLARSLIIRMLGRVDASLLGYLVAAMLDSTFILLASRTLIARFVARVDRLNAVLVLPFVAWVASTLASMLASTLASTLASSLGFDSTPLAFDDADCSLTSIHGRLDRWSLVAQDDRLDAAPVDHGGCLEARLASWSRNARSS
jgi:hypothetical protein